MTTGWWRHRSCPLWDNICLTGEIVKKKIILVHTVILKSSTLTSCLFVFVCLFVFAFLVAHSGNEQHSHFLVSIQMNWNIMSAQKTCTWKLVASLCIIARTWKLQRFPSVCERINKLECSQTTKTLWRKP